LTKTLPKWLANRYSVLWKECRERKFTFEEAQKMLRERDQKTLSVVLSDLRKYGWLTAELDPNTSRKRLYRLKSPQVVIDEIAIEQLKENDTEN
jgi:DNA-binding HxlR family transcriptional regulator